MSVALYFKHFLPRHFADADRALLEYLCMSISTMFAPWMPPLPAAWQATERCIASTRLWSVHCWQVFWKPSLITNMLIFIGNQTDLVPWFMDLEFWWLGTRGDHSFVPLPFSLSLSLSSSLFISRMEHNGTVYQGELLPTSQCEGNAEKLKQRADSHYSLRSLLPSKSALHLNLTSTRLRFSKLSLCC